MTGHRRENKRLRMSNPILNIYTAGQFESSGITVKEGEERVKPEVVGDDKEIVILNRAKQLHIES